MSEQEQSEEKDAGMFGFCIVVAGIALVVCGSLLWSMVNDAKQSAAKLTKENAELKAAFNNDRADWDRKITKLRDEIKDGDDSNASLNANLNERIGEVEAIRSEAEGAIAELQQLKLTVADQAKYIAKLDGYDKENQKWADSVDGILNKLIAKCFPQPAKPKPAAPAKVSPLKKKKT